MLVKKAEPLPVECIVRGYLSGSAWLEYQEKGSICDIPLPSGLVESDRLPRPIFTPSTKAEEGIHDRNISFDEVIELLGRRTAEDVGFEQDRFPADVEFLYPPDEIDRLSHHFFGIPAVNNADQCLLPFFKGI